MAGFRKRMSPAAVALLLSTGGHTLAADFYAGKTITILVGSDVGGGFDSVARMVGRHLGRFVPGAPKVIVENMPGAGSGTAANHVYTRAARDGTVIGALAPGGLLAPLFEQRVTGFDPTKFQYVGSADSSARLCISLRESRIKTFRDAQTQTVVVGAAAVASASYDYGFLHKNAHGGNFNVVAGYKGTAEILLAMERGEVEMTCGLDWYSVNSTRPTLAQNGGFNLLLKVAVRPEPELERLGVPDADTFAPDERRLAIGRLVGAQQNVGRPYLVAPGVPADRVEILRQAFVQAVGDPELQAESARLKVHVAATPGARVQEAVDKMYAAPADLREGARQAIRP